MPLATTMSDGKSAYHIVMVKTRTQPHKANLIDDYQKIQEVAVSEKQNKTLSDWVEKRIKSTYISISTDAGNCTNLDHWKKTAN